MDLRADVRGVIETKLTFIRTLCRSERDEQCHSVLASEAMLSLLWNGVARRQEKTRPKAEDRGKELVPKGERKFLAQAVNSPIGPRGMQFLYPDSNRRKEMHQAYAVAELLRDMFFITQNSNCDSVVQAPKAPIAEPARLARECAEHANARRARAQGKRFMAEMYGVCGPEHHADRMVAESEVDRADADILTQAARIFAEQRKDHAEPRPRQREASPRDKRVCDQISRAMMSRFGRPLDNLAAQAASMLLNRTISRSVVRSAREGRERALSSPP